MKPQEHPYTMREVELVLETHAMETYHRELMKWLVKEVAAEREACAKVALSCVSPMSIDDWTDGHDYARHQIAAAIRSRSTPPSAAADSSASAPAEPAAE